LTKVKQAKAMKLTPLDALEQAAECLKTLAHPHRLRMIQKEGRKAYYQIAEPHLAQHVQEAIDTNSAG
jgi:hypothetical protein